MSNPNIPNNSLSARVEAEADTFVESKRAIKQVARLASIRNLVDYLGSVIKGESVLVPVSTSEYFDNDSPQTKLPAFYDEVDQLYPDTEPALHTAEEQADIDDIVRATQSG